MPYKRWNTGDAPFGAAHRPEKDRITCFCLRKNLIGQGYSMLIDTAAAHQCELEVELDAGQFRDGFQNLNGFGDYFWPNAITGQDED